MDMKNSQFGAMPKLDVVGAAQTQFGLNVKGINPDSMRVLGFEATDHGMSADYRFAVTVALDYTPNPQEFIGARASFQMVWDAQTLYVHGVISEVASVSRRAEGETYVFVVSSPVYPLKHRVQNRVFLNKSSRDIIEEVLQSAGMNNADFQFRAQGEYAVREYTVQFDESDFDFIRRLMAHDGMFFTIDNTEQGARLVIHDSVDQMPKLPGGGELLYQVLTGNTRPVEAVFALRRRTRLQTENIRLMDYNYRTPEARLQVETQCNAEIDGCGMDYRFGENYKTLDEGDRIAKIRQQALDWQRDIYVAESDCRGLAPGMVFTLSGHPNEEFNVDYMVLEVEHLGDQSAGQAMGGNPKSMTYRNTVLLIRAGIPYRMPMPPRRTVQGVFTAKVETTGGTYAYLDNQGRYHVRLPFDLSQRSEGEASHPVRLMEPYAGGNYGMHFPLHAGTEVLIGCANGDVDRPILLGAVANPDTQTTVTAANHSQNIVRTWAGNELLMEDRRGEERVELFTRDRKNVLTLDANANGHLVRMATVEGKLEHYAKKTLLMESGDTQTVQSGNDHHVLVKNNQELMTKNKEITLQSATEILLQADEHILMQAESKDVSMTAGKDMYVTVENNMSAQIRNQDFSMQVNSANLTMQAAKAITVQGQGGGLIHVGQGGGSFEISTGGDLSVSGQTVTISAPTINVKGNTISNN